ncbi:hypothetical protein GGQ68_003969 [Sagittula marina]|uniref:Uncharacterized protein n=1 Tax=Sagittula marina TaxID=943940 RepID=A0A7W6DRH2_9RHOB|nr:hypothetical protein [Sagittula marina]
MVDIVAVARIAGAVNCPTGECEAPFHEGVVTLPIWSSGGI